MVKRVSRSTSTALALALIFAVLPGARGDTIWVPDDYPTIQGAIDAAVDGDSVCVRPGLYHEMINFIGKAIKLCSEQGPNATFIDGAGFRRSTVRCISGEGPDTRLVGFTIQNGDGATDTDGGAGMYCNGSSPTVINCIFRNNRASNGGAMANYYDANPTLANCVFFENWADTGGSNKGGGVFNAYGSNPTLINCTFVANVCKNGSDPFGGGMASSENSNPRVINSIFWGNTAPRDPQIGGPAVVSYSDLQGGYPGEGNIDCDPQFVDPANGDVHLSAGSCAIDAGDTTAVLSLGVFGDLDGYARVVDDPAVADTGIPAGLLGHVVDMGAYEYKYRIPGDIDSDGCVSQGDLGILLANWGMGCP